jgi:hypothetical protein
VAVAVPLKDIIATCSLPALASRGGVPSAFTWTPGPSVVFATVDIARGSPTVAVVQVVAALPVSLACVAVDPVFVARGSPTVTVVVPVVATLPVPKVGAAVVLLVPSGSPAAGAAAAAAADLIATCSLPVAAAPEVVRSAFTWTPGPSATVVAWAARGGITAVVEGAALDDVRTFLDTDPSGRRTTS